VVKYGFCMKKAFTIAELVVAVAIMAVVLAGTGYIFKVAIDAQRMANATAEIMRNLRGITDQLSTDFSGLQTDAPMAIWFQQDNAAEPNRFDEIMFFSAGDFSSYMSPPRGATISGVLRGNAARIYYGQSHYFDSVANNWILPSDTSIKPKDRILGRNQHILIPSFLSPDPYIIFPGTNFSGFANVDPDGRFENERYEYDKLSLAQWKLIDVSAFQTYVVPNSLGDIARLHIDTTDVNNLMCKGVGSFAIQWGYEYTDAGGVEWRWWPSNDPAGDGDTSKSHFNGTGMMGAAAFGVFFNIDGTAFADWYPIGDAKYETNGQAISFPSALKFTIKLYDSKGILKGGRTFTHIVYLKN
jgi:prepilin-type N-terminal cleavage/methylation domain-containing protein